jgi:hypothetical protein
MLDFNTSLTIEFVAAKLAERNREADKLRWNRRLREIAAESSPPGNARGWGWRFGDREARRRRELFAAALDAAQREGITVDAWFGFRFSDPELSARAEWAGLIEEAPRGRGRIAAA